MNEAECRQASGGYEASKDVPIDASVAVRLYGGKFAGAGATLGSVENGSAFRDARYPIKRAAASVERDGGASEPAPGARDPSCGSERSAASTRARLRATWLFRSARCRTASCVLSLLDPDEKATGARVIFARLLVSIKSKRIGCARSHRSAACGPPAGFHRKDAQQYRTLAEAQGLRMASCNSSPKSNSWIGWRCRESTRRPYAACSTLDPASAVCLMRSRTRAMRSRS